MGDDYSQKPNPFFIDKNTLVIDEPGLSGLNVGYECSEWRYDAFADYIMEWLPEFASKYSELSKYSAATAMKFIRAAARRIYTTEHAGRRGEFGEILLHAVMRERFESEPVISKIYYKSATNDTVKGFDAVHIVAAEDGLELWLGEVKFYQDVNAAIHDVALEIISHSQRDYLKDEFALIVSKIDETWPYAGQVKQLMGATERVSLDTVFQSVCIPVLLTYSSKTVADNSKISEDFIILLKEELRRHHETFVAKTGGIALKLHLFLLPLADKERLVETLDAKLKGLQR